MSRVNRLGLDLLSLGHLAMDLNPGTPLSMALPDTLRRTLRLATPGSYVAQRWQVRALTIATQTSSALLRQGMRALFVFVQSNFGLSRAELGLFLAAMESSALATLLLCGWATAPRRSAPHPTLSGPVGHCTAQRLNRI